MLTEKNRLMASVALAWQRMSKVAQTTSPRRRRDAGMSLLEVLIVLALISLIAGTVGVMVFNNYKKGLARTAKVNVSEVAQQIEIYMMDNSHECPATLDDLVSGSYLKEKQKKDPWGQDMILKCPGEHDTNGFDIMSKGPDKKEGTDDDINSWEI